jgi:type II secretory pathway component PulF
MEHILAIEREVKDVTARLAAAEEQHKTLFTRLDRQEKMLDTVHKLALSVSELANKQGNMETKLDGLCNDVEEIKEKPGKRWDALVEKILFTIVGSLVTFLLAKIGII